MAGLVHYKFLKTDEPITAKNYCAEIEVMHKKLIEKRPALVNRRGPILLHDNAFRAFQKFLSRKMDELDTKLCHIQHFHQSVSY